MYPHEIEHASSKILEILEIDINSLSEVKYKELGEFVSALTTVHYSKGHDDGYTLCSGYSRK